MWLRHWMAYRRIFNKLQCHRCHQCQHRNLNPFCRQLHSKQLKIKWMTLIWVTRSGCRFNRISSIHIVDQVCNLIYQIPNVKFIVNFEISNRFSFSGVENTELYRNNVSNNSYGMQSHPSNLMNGHHHDMQINNFGQPNGYSMNLKQEPDVNFWQKSMSLCDNGTNYNIVCI